MDELDPTISSTLNTEYIFEQDNPYLLHNSPMAEYERLIAMDGTLMSTIALVLEAVVQQDSGNSDAWMKLGRCLG